MKDRYFGRGGQAARIAALRKQRTLANASDGLLARLAKAATIKQLRKGQVVITQDVPNTDLFFVLCGAGLQVIINRRPHALRECGELLGEMSMLVRNGKPAATVRAAGPTVVARIEQEKFMALADKHPAEVWRGIAVMLAERLQQRNAHIRPRADVPRVFIGSSREREGAARVARKALVDILGRKVKVVLWSDSNEVFKPGSTTMADLVEASQGFDFGLFVFAPDDELRLRKITYEAVRDNVVLELGLYMGAFSDPKRALMLQPKGAGSAKKTLRKPTDLDGMTVLMYDPSDEEGTIREEMARFAEVIKERGPR